MLRYALLGDPDFQDHAHAFLIPDEGFSDVVHLLDRLYSGPLADDLRLDFRSFRTSESLIRRPQRPASSSWMT